VGLPPAAIFPHTRNWMIDSRSAVALPQFIALMTCPLPTPTTLCHQSRSVRVKTGASFGCHCHQIVHQHSLPLSPQLAHLFLPVPTSILQPSSSFALSISGSSSSSLPHETSGLISSLLDSKIETVHQCMIRL
jgi:hypothetical protein